jgi:hypothetical protein
MSFPSYSTHVCASCWFPYTTVPNPVIGCRACGKFASGANAPVYDNSDTAIPYVAGIPTQKQIQHTVRVDSSEYIMNKGALNVYTHPVATYQNVNWNQMSDRAVPGVVNRNVPSHGSSTRSSITRMRPGSMSAPSTAVQGSKGVDMKHGSYDRYLAKLKGKKPLRTETQLSTANVVPKYGNKTRMFGIAYSDSCVWTQSGQC